MSANNAPICKWFRFEMVCGTKRHKLYVDGKETAYFIDSAATAAHRTYGKTHGLYGAGMSEPHWRTCYRSAAVMGCGSRIADLKHRAEQMALSALEMA